jgi:hypothetical protein
VPKQEKAQGDIRMVVFVSVGLLALASCARSSADQRRLHHAAGHDPANRSRSHIEPVSGTARTGLRHRETEIGKCEQNGNRKMGAEISGKLTTRHPSANFAANDFWLPHSWTHLAFSGALLLLDRSSAHLFAICHALNACSRRKAFQVGLWGDSKVRFSVSLRCVQCINWNASSNAGDCSALADWSKPPKGGQKRRKGRDLVSFMPFDTMGAAGRHCPLPEQSYFSLRSQLTPALDRRTREMHVVSELNLLRREMNVIAVRPRGIIGGI